jgi:hypothetical protein
MSDSDITVDTSDFDEAFTRYIAVTGYTVKQGLYYQLRNWLVKASQYAYGREATFIANPDPKLVAFLMSSGKHGERGGGQRKEYGTHAMGQHWVTGKRRKNGTRAPSHWKQDVSKEQVRGRKAMLFYTRDEARRFAVKHFDMRKRTARFIGSFLGAMKREINANVEESGGKIVGENKRLSELIKTTSFSIGDGIGVLAQYGYKHETTAAKKVTTQESANRLEKILREALDNAAQDIIPNMEEKIARDLEAIASGRKVYAA